MIFHSLSFIYFLAIVWTLHLVLAQTPRKLLLLAASYVFYGWWDWRFLALLIGHSIVDYAVALAMQRTGSEQVRRALVTTSILTALGLLGVFKYFDFFAEGFTALAAGFGLNANLPTLGLIVPVGISFYTFQTMSYVIDVYRRRVPAERNLLDFCLFVAFFPQLVAGPLERAAIMLPQFKVRSAVTYERMREGLTLVLLGYFKKLVIADNLAFVVRDVTTSIGSASASDLILGLYTMPIFLFCDFSGYSDIARGLAKWFGYELSINFKVPLMARSPSDFWRRWHVTLSEWMRDYVFRPLVRLRVRPSPAYLTACGFFTLLLCGLWHGAGLNYVTFGAAHGVLLAGHVGIRSRLRRSWRMPRWCAVVLAFHAVSAPTLLFFIERPADWVRYFARMSEAPLFGNSFVIPSTFVAFAIPALVLEFFQDRAGDKLVLRGLPRPARMAAYALLLVSILLCGQAGSDAFTYFQF